MIGLEAGGAGARQLGQRGAQLLDHRALDVQRRQVGFGKVAVVVRLFLRALRDRLVGRVDEAARLLLDPLAGIEHRGLALDLELDRALDGAEGVHVLHLDLGAQLLSAVQSQRHVRVATERALLHVGVGDARVAVDLAQRA